MGPRMKGIYKGFKYTLSQIFVVKEREIEIGYPTDVKHLAHIGWDGPSGNAAPSWMNEFKTGPDFAATSIGNSFSGPYPWSSQDFGESMRQPLETDTFENAAALSELSNAAKKKQSKRKKSKSTSSSSSSSSLLWSSEAAKPPKSNFMGGGAKTTDIVVS